MAGKGGSINSVADGIENFHVGLSDQTHGSIDLACRDQVLLAFSAEADRSFASFLDQVSPESATVDVDFTAIDGIQSPGRAVEQLYALHADSPAVIQLEQRRPALLALFGFVADGAAADDAVLRVHQSHAGIEAGSVSAEAVSGQRDQAAILEEDIALLTGVNAVSIIFRTCLFF